MNFETVATNVVNTLQANGGSMEYKALYGSLDGVQIMHLPKALDYLKSSNQVRQSVSYDASQGKITHLVALV